MFIFARTQWNFLISFLFIQKRIRNSSISKKNSFLYFKDFEYYRCSIDLLFKLDSSYSIILMNQNACKVPRLLKFYKILSINFLFEKSNVLFEFNTAFDEIKTAQAIVWKCYCGHFISNNNKMFRNYIFLTHMSIRTLFQMCSFSLNFHNFRTMNYNLQKPEINDDSFTSRYYIISNDIDDNLL